MVRDTLSKFQELASSAREVCAFVENIENEEERAWLPLASRNLAVLHAAMEQFNTSEVDYKFFTVPDMDSRFELYCRLKSFFNDCDSYPLEREEMASKVSETGSLADDFTDIYLELKRGLNVLDAAVFDGEEAALKLWQSGFMLHWGQHLVDAQKHLYQLRVQALYSSVPAVRAR